MHDSSAMQGNTQGVFVSSFISHHIQAANTNSAHFETILLGPPMLLQGQVVWTAAWRGHWGTAHAQTKANSTQAAANQTMSVASCRQIKSLLVQGQDVGCCYKSQGSKTNL